MLKVRGKGFIYIVPLIRMKKEEQATKKGFPFGKGDKMI
jgi:hypothetical protein